MVRKRVAEKRELFFALHFWPWNNNPEKKQKTKKTTDIL
jgi:hypothetical protein